MLYQIFCKLCYSTLRCFFNICEASVVVGQVQCMDIVHISPANPYFNIVTIPSFCITCACKGKGCAELTAGSLYHCHDYRLRYDIVLLDHLCRHTEFARLDLVLVGNDTPLIEPARPAYLGHQCGYSPTSA